MDFTSSGGHIFPSLNMNIKVSNCIIFVLFLTLSTSAHRSRRFLTFPRTQPTQISLISGIGIPVSMLEIESVTIGYVFKAQFFLPENASNYLNPLNDPFDLTPQPISGMNRKRRFLDGEQPTESPQQNDDGFDSEQNERYERHEVRADVIERGTKASDVEEIIDNGPWIDQESGFSDDPRALKTPQYLGTSRFSLYKSIAAVADSKGLSGKACVLRSICESAHIPFDYSNGILGEMMHVIMSPSSTQDQVSDYADYEYYRAEKLGKEGAPCEQIFKECKTSLLEQFTGIYTPVMDLFQNIIN